MINRCALLALCGAMLCSVTGCTERQMTDRSAVVPILMYHHINDLPANADEGARTWTVSASEFNRQMNWLVEHHYHSITFAQLADALERGERLPEKPIILTFDDGWDIGYGVVFPILKRVGLSGTFFVYPGAIGENPGSGYLTWGQLLEMSAAGMDIQAHSMTHPHMRGLSAEAQRREIVDARAILERRLNRQIVAFAYPFGEYSDSTIASLRDAGYRCAAGIEPGYTQRRSDLFRLSRTRISYGDTLDTFKERVTAP